MERVQKTAAGQHARQVAHAKQDSGQQTTKGGTVRTQEETRRDEVRMDYLFDLVAVQGESLAKNLRELADIGERLGFTQESVESVRDFADAVDEIKVLANTKGSGE